jgi:hypothetical protein
VPDVADQAETLLRQAVAGRGGDYARSKTLNLIALSATFFQRDAHLEEGIRIGDQALRGADTLTSPRALDRLRTLRSLTDRRAHESQVAAFRGRLDAVLDA